MCIDSYGRSEYRPSEVALRILIETVPFSEIPNAQCGDWRREADGVLHIKVAQEIGDDSALLVAFHEMVECCLCEKRGITCAEVDVFDANFEANRKPGDTSEAGYAHGCPYSKEHHAATLFERAMAIELGVDFAEHEERINNLT